VDDAATMQELEGKHHLRCKQDCQRFRNGATKELIAKLEQVAIRAVVKTHQAPVFVLKRELQRVHIGTGRLFRENLQ